MSYNLDGVTTTGAPMNESRPSGMDVMNELFGVLLVIGGLLLGFIVFIAFMWGLLFGTGGGTPDTLNGDSYGECQVVGGDWNQTGSDPAYDGYCILR